MSQPLIIFDLDGTLAHTGPDLLGTLNRVTAPHEVAPLNVEDLNYVLGQGAKAMIAKAFEIQGKTLSKELHEQLFSEYLIDYEANICNETHLFEGLLEAMKALQSSGYCFAICTNKTERLARILLSKLGLTENFKAITGGDSFAFRKPDGRHLIETATLAGCKIKDAIMIGDSKADIGAAINANIPSVAVTFGYSDIPAKELGASAVIDHFEQLPEIISKIKT